MSGLCGYLLFFWFDSGEFYFFWGVVALLKAVCFGVGSLVVLLCGIFSVVFGFCFLGFLSSCGLFPLLLADHFIMLWSLFLVLV